MTAQRYDAIVIGTGQGGKPLARALAQAGRKTAIIERDTRVGGTCVLTGCTPTKTMVASARVAHLVRRAADFGVHTSSIAVDLARVRQRKRDIVERFSSGSRKGLEETDGLELIFGAARFTDRCQLEITTPAGETLSLAADMVFINTGTRPAVPAIPGIEQVPYLDNATIMELDTVPEHLLVIGGGYVGIEFGQMFCRFGSRVTMVQRSERLLTREDDDVANEVAKILQEDGVELRLSSEVVKLERDGELVVATVASPNGEERSPASHLLVAAGRTPNSDALDLEAAGVATDERGFVVVNHRLETNVLGIYALGDITGGPAFTHISYDDFRVLRDNLLTGGNRSTEGRLVPYVVFMDPELGRVGLTEREARERELDVRVAKLPMSRVARALESDETRGLMKAVVDAESGCILGCTILGVHGGEVMSVVEAAMMGKLPYTALEEGIFAHPTLAESLNNLFMELAD